MSTEVDAKLKWDALSESIKKNGHYKREEFGIKFNEALKSACKETDYEGIATYISTRTGALAAGIVRMMDQPMFGGNNNGELDSFEVKNQKDNLAYFAWSELRNFTVTAKNYINKNKKDKVLVNPECSKIDKIGLTKEQYEAALEGKFLNGKSVGPDFKSGDCYPLVHF